MKIEEAVKMLKSENFNGHVECEDFDSKTLKCIISFDRESRKWTTHISDWYKNLATLKHFYASPDQLISDKWVFYSKSQDNWFTEYEGK